MKKNNFILIIPARYNSSRLPGKPLKQIKGKSMIIRTCNQCAKAVDKKKIFVATDDKRIIEEVKNQGFNYYRTSKKCLTGSDRVAEIAKKTKYDHYINIQGDEPIFNPNDIRKLVKEKNKFKKNVLLGYTDITEKKDVFNRSIPKVVVDQNNFLVFASRNANLLKKNENDKRFYRQVLAYCFPRKYIIKFSNVKNKTFFEKKEDIEILRFLELGIKVKMIKMSRKSISVDTLKDLNKVRKLINQA